MLDKLKNIVPNTKKSHLLLLLFFLILATFVEILGIGSIPIFVSLIVDHESIIKKIPFDYVKLFLGNYSQKDLVIFGSILLGSFFFLKNIFLAFLLYFEAKLILSVKIINSKKLFENYITSPYSFHLNTNPSKLIRAITADITQSTNYIKNLVMLSKESFILILILILLLIVDPIISSLIFLLLGSIVIIFFLLVKNKLKSKGENYQILQANLFQILSQSFNLIKDIIIFGKSNYLSNIFEKKFKQIEYNQLFSKVLSSLPRLILEIISVLCVLIVTLVFFLLDRPVQEIIPIISLISISVIRLIPAFNGITKSLSSMKYNQASLDLISSQLNQFKNKNIILTKYEKNLSSLKFLKNIELKNISFSYDKNKKILDDISFRIEKNEKLAISGRTGSGKTTIVDIIIGLLKPTSGSLLIDGRSIDENLDGWRKSFGYISQNINLLDDTIKKNIAFGIPEDLIDDNRVVNALKFAQLYDFVLELENGYNTIIGNQGVRISGGQRQRIAIARAAYSDPEIFILDEATSALDTETERNFIIDLQKIIKNKTLIIISHRLETIKDCDKIILIEKGKIKKIGKYDKIFS